MDGWFTAAGHKASPQEVYRRGYEHCQVDIASQGLGHINMWKNITVVSIWVGVIVGGIAGDTIAKHSYSVGYKLGVLYGETKRAIEAELRDRWR